MLKFDTDVIATAITIGIPILTFVAWLFRLEGRVNQNARDLERYEKSTDKKFEDVERDVKATVDHIFEALRRIEDKLDRKADKQ